MERVSAQRGCCILINVEVRRYMCMSVLFGDEDCGEDRCDGQEGDCNISEEACDPVHVKKYKLWEGKVTPLS